MAIPGLASLSTHPVASLDGLVKHGLAGGGQWQRHLVVGVVGGVGVGGPHGRHRPVFDVKLLGNSVRAGKAFPVGFFFAVQPSLAWSVALSRKLQLKSPY